MNSQERFQSCCFIKDSGYAHVKVGICTFKSYSDSPFFLSQLLVCFQHLFIMLSCFLAVILPRSIELHQLFLRLLRFGNINHSPYSQSVTRYGNLLYPLILSLFLKKEKNLFSKCRTNFIKSHNECQKFSIKLI